jgi:hypothetical protein
MNLRPFATMVLAQQGADVVKVERPPVGDILRKVGSGRGGASAYFVNTNWGKRSIALDFDTEADRATLRKLVATADVMVENFRPAVMPKLGFRAEELVAEHPGLIYAALRGFPSDSPLADAPAYDHVIQAMTGFGANQADLRTGVPVLVQQRSSTRSPASPPRRRSPPRFRTDPQRSRSGDRDPDAAAGLGSSWPDVSTNITMVGEFDKLPASHARSGSPPPPTATSR